MEKDKIDIERYYDSVAKNYYQQYQKLDIDKMTKYPQNYFRLQILIQRLVSLGIKSIYEVGTGEGTPLAIMAKMGLQVAGCDISERMVEETRMLWVGREAVKSALPDHQPSASAGAWPIPKFRHPWRYLIPCASSSLTTRRTSALR